MDPRVSELSRLVHPNSTVISKLQNPPLYLSTLSFVHAVHGGGCHQLPSIHGRVSAVEKESAIEMDKVAAERSETRGVFNGVGGVGTISRRGDVRAPRANAPQAVRTRTPSHTLASGSRVHALTIRPSSTPVVSCVFSIYKYNKVIPKRPVTSTS